MDVCTMIYFVVIKKKYSTYFTDSETSKSGYYAFFSQPLETLYWKFIYIRQSK